MCTNFLLAVPTDPGTPGSKTYASARTVELAGVVHFSLYLIPRRQNFPLEPAPPVPDPLKWTNPYGFIAIADPDSFANQPSFVDGMNERGLGLGALWLPGTVYPPSGTKPNVFYQDFGAWVLGNFATVAEVEKGLHEISVVDPPVPMPVGPTNSGPDFLVIHFIVTDPTGASLVVEFIDGVMRVYTAGNTNGATNDGVLTNAPPYDWQRANLANYIHLNVVNPATSTSPTAPNVGSSLLGMPGDPMSASRFVRAATMRKGFGLLPSDGSGWLPAPGGIAGKGYSGPEQTVVNIAMQLVQVVMAIPYGTLLAPGKESKSPPQVGDWTMWAVVRDHTHRKYYFTTAFNGILRGIDLDALDFNCKPPYPTIPLLPSSDAWYEDATKQFS
jgi:choloylglycine hydrolase